MRAGAAVRAEPGAQRRPVVVFVDDEPGILRGLRTRLRRWRRRWSMHFVTSAHEALEFLAEHPCDIVVTDIRMPRMDGVELLRRLVHDYPAVGRIVLSGYADELRTAEALALAHQYLAKPCPGEVIAEAVERVLDARAKFSAHADPVLSELVGGVDALPPAPKMWLALRDVLDSKTASARQVADVVSRDPALCAKILHIVNSAWFGSVQKVTSIAQAVSMLGADMLQAIVLTLEGLHTLQPRGGPIPLEVHQGHAVNVARVASGIAPGELRSEAFLAGMLHDIGLWLLAARRPELLEEVVEHARETRAPLVAVERQVLGTDHASLGEALLTLWDLPEAVRSAVGAHHDLTRDSSPLSVAVHVADGLVGVVAPIVEGVETAPLDEAALLATGATLDDIARWRRRAEATLGGG